MAYWRTYGLPCTISRCSNNYGPYQFPEKLIPLMIANALNDKPLPVYGEGKNVRDWLYVEDHCKAIDLIIHQGRVGEVYNIGVHNEMANIDIVRLICRELDKPESLITYVGIGRGMICATPSIPPRSTASSAGCRKPGSPTASGRPSGGIWKTAPGGRRSSPESTGIITKRCTGTGKLCTPCVFSLFPSRQGIDTAGKNHVNFLSRR